MNRRSFLEMFGLGAAGLWLPRKSYFFLGSWRKPPINPSVYDPANLDTWTVENLTGAIFWDMEMRTQDLIARGMM